MLWYYWSSSELINFIESTFSYREIIAFNFWDEKGVIRLILENIVQQLQLTCYTKYPPNWELQPKYGPSFIYLVLSVMSCSKHCFIRNITKKKIFAILLILRALISWYICQNCPRKLILLTTKDTFHLCMHASQHGAVSAGFSYTAGRGKWITENNIMLSVLSEYNKRKTVFPFMGKTIKYWDEYFLGTQIDW